MSSTKSNGLPKYTKIEEVDTSKEVNILDMNSEKDSVEIDDDKSGEWINNDGKSEYLSISEEEKNAVDEEEYINKCVSRLQDENLLWNIVRNMDKEGNLNDFLLLMELLSTGELPSNNIVLLLLLDRARFQRCHNTIGMHYRDVCKLFWSIVYRLCKGVGLKFFGGSKNWGQVISKKCPKSKYDPKISKINFAVPSEKVLRDYSRILPKIIPPGKIHCTMELLKNKKDIILMGNAKLVMKGLNENFCGDVNLFGHETNPNLENLKDYMDRRIDFISECVHKFKDSQNCDRFNILSDLTDLITKMNQRVWNYHKSENQKLLRYMSGKYPTKPEKAVSACKTNIHTSSIWVMKSLRINEQFFTMMTTLQRNYEMTELCNKIDITKCSNIRLLHSSN